MKNPRKLTSSSIIIIQTFRATAYTYQSNPPILNRNNHARFQNPIQRILAVATAQNFGILGNGRLHILDLPPTPSSPFVEIASFNTADGVYDVAWSESHNSLKIYDLSLPPTSNPIRSLHEHTREVQSVDYNPVRRDSFISSSWDDSIKLWTLDRPTSIRSFQEHVYCDYAAVWNPRHADVFTSASGDCTLRVWDVREPDSTMVVAAHEFEILSCDWNKYDDCVIATAFVDKSVRVWDISF